VKFLEKRIGLLLSFAVFAIFIVASGWAADQQSLTGTVSDSMCGKQHMDGTPAECTRTCVSHGAKYTLVAGEKMYSLNTTDPALRNVLSQQAGKNVTVTGTVNGVGVEVSSVVPAK
jgi:hypothetical protein